MRNRPESRPQGEHIGDVTPSTALVTTPQRMVDSVMAELGHILWQQRDLVLALIYRLEVQQLVLASGRTQWIARSTEDVDQAIEDIRRQEVARSGLVEDLAGLLGTPPDASLRELVDVAPEPWDAILAEHHTEFLRLANQAEDAARSNRDVLDQGLADVRDLLESYGSTPVSSYGAHASRPTAPAASVLVDREV